MKANAPSVPMGVIHAPSNLSKEASTYVEESHLFRLMVAALCRLLVTTLSFAQAPAPTQKPETKAAPAAEKKTPATSEKKAPTELIDLNSATKEQLQTLPSIGDS